MALDSRSLVLVTGMSGLIGGLAGRELVKSYPVRALNRRDVPGFETVRADISDFDAIRPAFTDIHTVVHLSALLIQVPDRDLLRVNVGGTYNVFEAARQAGVKRVVFASSGAVMGGYMKEEPYRSLLEWKHPALPEVSRRLRDRQRQETARAGMAGAAAGAPDTSRPWKLMSHLDPVRPTTFYAVTKVAGEATGQLYHEAHGMSVICIRFGAVFPDDRPPRPSGAAVYMSQRDAAQVVVKSVEAPDSVGYEVFYALSDNAARFRDIDRAREVTGFVPQDGIVEWASPAAGA